MTTPRSISTSLTNLGQEIETALTKLQEKNEYEHRFNETLIKLLGEVMDSLGLDLTDDKIKDLDALSKQILGKIDALKGNQRVAVFGVPNG